MIIAESMTRRAKALNARCAARYSVMRNTKLNKSKQARNKSLSTGCACADETPRVWIEWKINNDKRSQKSADHTGYVAARRDI